MLSLMLVSAIFVSATGVLHAKDYRVLSPAECKDIEGGACILLVLKYVYEGLCVLSIGATGWMVLQETWDDCEPGSQSGGTYCYPTQIRQATEGDGYTCETIDEFEEVFESYLN